jgi:hypothetical protein
VKEEEDDVNKTQSVTEPVADTKDQTDVKDADIVTGDDVNKTQSVTEDTVPYSRFKEVNDAKSQAEQRAAALEMALQQGNQRQAERVNPYEAVLNRLGFQKDDFLNAEQQTQVFSELLQMMSVNQAGQNFVQSHPDFSKVVGTDGPTGQFVPAAPLQRALSKPENAYIVQAIQTGNPYARQMAYHAAVNDPEYQAQLKDDSIPPAQKAAADAKAVIEASKRPASISAAHGGGGQLNKSQVLSNMTDAEFIEWKSKVMAKG